MRYKTLLLFFITYSSLLYAQDTTAYERLHSFVRNAQAFNHLYPQEKVYLHLDNTGYYLGERIYLQAYVVAASTLAPTNLSRVLYVELLSAEGNLIETKKLKIENGRASGDFILKSDELFGGYYELRAYTRSMLNFDDAGVFSRVVPVYDKPKQEGNYTEQKMIPHNKQQVVDKVREAPPKLSALNLVFFPEGGNLVKGLHSRVAFKATDRSGKSVDVKGTIYNETEEVACSVTTLHNGMGIFEFAPKGGKYTAVVEYDGKLHKSELPRAQPSGYTLRVDNLHPQTLRVYLTKSQNLSSDSVGVVLMCRGKVEWFHVLSVGEKTLALQIPKQDLPSGVAQLTVFGAGGEVYAERLLFISDNEEQRVKITPTVHATYAPLSPIKVDFQLADAKSKPVKTSFSLSVYDAETAPLTNYIGSLMTSLLLTSDVKGYVENPAYYFEKTDRSRGFALDLLLMVQGWRRYEWQTVASGNPLEVKHWVEKGLLVEGTVLTDIRHKPMKDAKVSMWLLVPDTTSQRGECLTDEKGNFNFMLEDFYGEGDLNLMSLKDGKRQWSDITLKRNFEVTPRPYSFYEILPARLPSQKSSTAATTADTASGKPDAPSQHADVSRSYELEEVKVSGFQRWIGERNKTTTVMYKMQDIVDKVRDMGGTEYGGFIDQFNQENRLYYNSELGEWIYNARPAVIVVFPRAEMFEPLTYGNVKYLTSLTVALNPPEEVLADEVDEVIVDEVGYYDMEKKNNIAIIYVILNKKQVRRLDIKGLRNTPFQGFYKPAEFFSPNYSEYVLPDEKDFRRTLYWNPNVETDTEGKATVQFYNNSNCKEVGISAETVTESGTMGWYKK